MNTFVLIDEEYFSRIFDVCSFLVAGIRYDLLCVCDISNLKFSFNLHFT